MRRDQLEHIIRAAADVTKQKDLIIIGSQAILGQYPNAPESLLVSMEADIYAPGAPHLSDYIDGALGPDTAFDTTHGIHADGVSPTTASLPAGWRTRLFPIRNPNTNGATGWCIEVHDIAIAKYAAGRDKDLRYTGDLWRYGMLDPGHPPATAAEHRTQTHRQTPYLDRRHHRQTTTRDIRPALSSCRSRIEQLLTRRLHRAIAVDVHVQRRRGDPEPTREVLRVGLARSHGAHRHSKHGAIHLARPSALATSRPGRRKASAGAFDDEFALELRQRREDPEHQTPVRSGGVDLGAGAREYAKTHAAGAQLVHGAHQVLQIASEPVELPHDERVSRLQRLEAGVEARAVILASGGAVFVDALRGDAGVEKRVALQVQELAPIGLGDPRIADQQSRSFSPPEYTVGIVQPYED